MRILTENREQLPKLTHIYLADSPQDQDAQKRPLKRFRFNKEYGLLTLSGCEDRSDAERLRDKTVMIDAGQAAPLGAGEYYLYQLIGMQVVADGVELGAIKQVLETGANDVYVVHSDTLGEILIPAHAETLVKIDFASQIVTMSLPEGLLADS